MKEIRANVLYRKSMNKKKKGVFYTTGKVFSDCNGDKRELFYRNKAKFFKDIPINSNQVGIIENGIFIRCFDSHPFTLDLKQKIDNCEAHMKHHEISFNEQITKIKREAENG